MHPENAKTGLIADLASVAVSNSKYGGLGEKAIGADTDLYARGLHSLSLISFTSEPHLGRLAQLSLVASKKRWLLRTSEQCAPHFPDSGSRAKARQRGSGKPLVDRHSSENEAESRSFEERPSWNPAIQSKISGFRVKPGMTNREGIGPLMPRRVAQSKQRISDAHRSSSATSMKCMVCQDALRKPPAVDEQHRKKAASGR